MKLRILAIILALSLVLCLCSCKNDKKEPDEALSSSDVQNNEQVTDVPTATDTPVSSESDKSVAEVTSNTATEENEESVSVEEEEEEIIDEYEYKAFEMLSLLNSDKVYAKFTELVSYDGEYISATENEIYVNGRNKVFITDDTKIIMDGEISTVIDFAEMTYYQYSYDEEEYGNTFGYDIDEYIPVSHIDEDGTVTEVFSVTQYGNEITSTWVFYPTGAVTVSEDNELAGSFYRYSFETVSTDISGMDMTIPDGLEEIEE